MEYAASPENVKFASEAIKQSELSIFEYTQLVLNAMKRLSGEIQNKKYLYELKLLSLDIAIFVTVPNQSLAIHNSTSMLSMLYEIINQTLPIHFSIYLTNEVVGYLINASEYMKFDTLRDTPARRNQLSFKHNDNMVIFDKARDDYVTIRSNISINQFAKSFIHIFIQSKSDEMWVGLMSKKYFSASKSLRNAKGSLTYYGGRENRINRYGGDVDASCRGRSGNDCNHGSIQSGGGVVTHPLNCFTDGDWVSIYTDLVAKKVCFSKNGVVEAQVPFKLSADKNEIFVVVEVDAHNDCLFIEQAIPLYN